MQSPQFITMPISEYQHLINEISSIKELWTEIEKLHKNIAVDRQRISKLENLKPEPRNIDRGKLLESLIISNGGAISRKEAKKLMRLSESQFSQLLKVSKDFIQTTQSKHDKRIKILKLK